MVNLVGTGRLIIYSSQLLKAIKGQQENGIEVKNGLAINLFQESNVSNFSVCMQHSFRMGLFILIHLLLLNQLTFKI